MASVSGPISRAPARWTRLRQKTGVGATATETDAVSRGPASPRVRGTVSGTSTPGTSRGPARLSPPTTGAFHRDAAASPATHHPGRARSSRFASSCSSTVLSLGAQRIGFYRGNGQAVAVYGGIFIALDLFDSVSSLVAVRRRLLTHPPSPALVRFHMGPDSRPRPCSPSSSRSPCGGHRTRRPTRGSPCGPCRSSSPATRLRPEA